MNKWDPKKNEEWEKPNEDNADPHLSELIITSGEEFKIIKFSIS